MVPLKRDECERERSTCVLDVLSYMSMPNAMVN